MRWVSIFGTVLEGTTNVLTEIYKTDLDTMEHSKDRKNTVLLQNKYSTYVSLFIYVYMRQKTKHSLNCKAHFVCLSQGSKLAVASSKFAT